MDLAFYDHIGTPIAYTEDGENIYLFWGKPVGYFAEDSIYSFSGRHLGWFSDGWLIDHAGNNALFSEEATGGPLRPLRQLKPLKGLKQLRPLKGLRQLKPLKPFKSFNWSDFSGEEFFEQ